VRRAFDGVGLSKATEITVTTRSADPLTAVTLTFIYLGLTATAHTHTHT